MVTWNQETKKNGRIPVFGDRKSGIPAEVLTPVREQHSLIPGNMSERDD